MIGATPEAQMPWIKPRYLWEDLDRHGNLRLYVKKPGQPKIRIRAERGSDDFWLAYALALEGKTVDETPRPEPIAVAADGSLGWLISQWKASPEYSELADATRTMRCQLLEAACLEPIGPGLPHLMRDIPIARLTSTHVKMLRDRKKATPEGANNRLRALRVVFKWYLDQDEMVRRLGLTTNPARDVPKFKSKNPDGFHTWTIEEVERYARTHKRGTMARLALDLFLFTGQRKSDVVLFGRQHMRDRIDDDSGAKVKKLVFTQRKNRARKPVTLELPVLDVLKVAIDQAPAGHLTFLVTSFGKPFSVKGFGNRMRRWCNQAELPQCSAHGLRKAGAVIAAENGATDAQMQAIFGWADPRMAAKYRRAASQKRLANDSMHLMVNKRAKAAIAPAPLLDWSPGKAAKTAS